MAKPILFDPQIALNRKKNKLSHFAIKATDVSTNPDDLIPTLAGTEAPNWKVKVLKVNGTEAPFTVILGLKGNRDSLLGDNRVTGPGDLTVTISSGGGPASDPAPVPIQSFIDDETLLLADADEEYGADPTGSA